MTWWRINKVYDIIFSGGLSLMEKLNLANQIRLEICQRKFNQETTKSLFEEYKERYHIQRSDIDRLYHDYLEARELEILYPHAKDTLEELIIHEEVKKALASEWIIFGDEMLPRRYYKTYHHHFSCFLIPGKLYTIEYMQQVMYEYTQALYAMKSKCISIRNKQRLQAGTSDYYKVRVAYKAPRREDELLLFGKGQNVKVDKKTVLNYLRLIGFDFEKTQTDTFITTNDRSKIALYIEETHCFAYLLSSKKLHFMIFDRPQDDKERCEFFLTGLNELYECKHHIVK